MSNDKTPAGERTAEDLLAEAEAQVLRLGRQLGEIIGQMECGELAMTGEVPATLAALDKALGAVFNERARRERNGGGKPAAGQLDLGAAQDEVRRRLDRLRAVADAGALRDGVE